MLLQWTCSEKAAQDASGVCLRDFARMHEEGHNIYIQSIHNIQIIPSPVVVFMISSDPIQSSPIYAVARGEAATHSDLILI